MNNPTDLSEISINDFTRPSIIDFETLDSGPISPTDSALVNFGFESISVLGGTPGNDQLNGTAVRGKSLVSVNGSLAIAAIGEPIDDGVRQGLPEYRLNLIEPTTKFGATVTDQFGPGFNFTFLREGVRVGSLNFGILNGNLSSATRYIQTQEPFDSVSITHPSGIGGYGIDNITIETAGSENQFFTNPTNGHIYFLTDPALGDSWTQAEAQAVMAGGHLVTINDPDEQAWLNNTLRTFVKFRGSFVQESFWIGLYDPQGDNTDEWVSGEPVTYTNWAGGEPNSAAEQYGELNPLFAPGQWNDRRNSPFPGLGGRGIAELPSHQLRRGDDSSNQLFGDSGGDVLLGVGGNDTLYGNGGTDILSGGTGDDLLYGGSEADTILGGSGNDVLYGNGGGDWINSGSGLDVIWLGSGSATIALELGEGFDHIKNFQLGATQLKVSSLDNLSFVDSTNGAQIFQGSDLIGVVAWQTASMLRSHRSQVFIL